jgi:PIN domain nuclease of toxin-antitoxin system
MKPLLLDTEVLIWWDANDKRLGPNARASIRDAEDVYVSAASAWEISIKVALGKLRTARRPSEAVVDADFRMLPVTFDHAEAVLALPAHHHDPFDRLIVAAARVENLAIVSSDRQLRAYDVSLIDART